MAWNISQCKEMIRVSDRTGKLLSIGHQRHYSMLYAHANEVVANGVLGDVKHIRALWHRNNVRPNPNESQQAERPLLDSWWPIIPREDREALESRIRRLGYKDMEELVRWRIYTRTGGGLMAELGSHQLDACSIFLDGLRRGPDSRIDPREPKPRPLAVTAVGGTHFYQDNREAEDHVYCIYEFPGPNYDPNNAASRRNDIVTVTYSSISTNGFEPYGECIMGSKGTLVVETEQNAYLYGIQGRATEVTTNTAGGRPVLDASSSTAPTERQAATAGSTSIGQTVSRGYREEMEHLAYCIRMREQAMEADREQLKPRCDGRAAMADAVIALTANQAMKRRERIEFRREWFELNANSERDAQEVPDADMIPRGPE
jgi:predicted dehydrogenase